VLYSNYMELFTFVDLQSQWHSVRAGLRNIKNLSWKGP